MTQNKLIEALERIKHSIAQARLPGNDWRRELALIENTATEALSTAQAQEPVAYRVDHPTSGDDLAYQPLTEADKAAGWTETPLYASPPAPSTPDAREVVEACAAEAAKYFDGALKPAVGWTDTQARWWEFGVDDAASAIAAAIRALPLPTPSAPDDEWEGDLTTEEQAMIDAAWEKHKAADPVCRIPPEGWICSRAGGHDGPCAARPAATAPSAPDAALREAIIRELPYDRDDDFIEVRRSERERIIAALSNSGQMEKGA